MSLSATSSSERFVRLMQEDRKLTNNFVPSADFVFAASAQNGGWAEPHTPCTFCPAWGPEQGSYASPALYRLVQPCPLPMPLGPLGAFLYNVRPEPSAIMRSVTAFLRLHTRLCIVCCSALQCFQHERCMVLQLSVSLSQESSENLLSSQEKWHAKYSAYAGYLVIVCS